MKWLIPATAVLACMASCTSQNKTAMEKTAYQWPQGIAAPVCDTVPKKFTAHGDTRMDEYYWLNQYWLKGPDSGKVVDYLKKENAYTDTMMSGTAVLRKTLYSEMKGRIKEKDESVPVLKNGYYYYSRTVEGTDYYLYCRKKGSLGAPEEVLADVNEMAKGHDYFAASGFSVSPDNKLMVFGVDTVSRRQYVLHIKNLETGQMLPDLITNTEGYAVWANDSKTLFYTSKNLVTLLSEKIKKHKVGTAATADITVYTEKDPSNYISVSKSKSEKYIIINSSATLSSEQRLLNADTPDGEFVVFQPRMKKVLYAVNHQNNRFLIVTNKDAKNFKLVECPEDKTGTDNWKDVLPHKDSILIEDVEVFKDFWVTTERKNGLIQMRIHNMADNSEHFVDFGEPSYLVYPSGNREYNLKMLRYTYTSLTTPNSEIDYDMITKEKNLLKEEEIPGGYNKGDYKTERLYATTKDGIKVPISLVYKKGIVKDGTAPCLLYGYGSYGNSIDASFNAARLSLLDRGFVYAIAHVRGGQEMGRQWYEDGKMLKKINTFTDFIAAAEFLIAEKFTSPGHLYANGGSAGGLLMGAIVNMRPDLWNGVVADVPFVDVITTMSDPSIPLTTNEYDEWGNPANKEAYDYMKSYSPYDNTAAKNYPNMLVTTGLHDSQVQYFEPAKWVARLRRLKTDKNLLLFKTNMEAGHGGKSGRFKYLEDVALRYAFYLSLEGISQ
jgi:oligopeptidase B